MRAGRAAQRVPKSADMCARVDVGDAGTAAAAQTNTRRKAAAPEMRSSEMLHAANVRGSAEVGRHIDMRRCAKMRRTEMRRRHLRRGHMRRSTAAEMRHAAADMGGAPAAARRGARRTAAVPVLGRRRSGSQNGDETRRT
jgi:hypothetical protein